MSKYTKVSIVLKDAINHNEYNRRIIEYLNDRHMAINDNMFTVAIDVADDTNINEFVLKGVESVPAMKINKEEPFIYGVNSILSALAKLEIVKNNKTKNSEETNKTIPNPNYSKKDLFYYNSSSIVRELFKQHYDTMNFL